MTPAIYPLMTVFLPTPSARRATLRPRLRRAGHVHFYPRPPRGGRRTTAAAPCRASAYFYPRPPRGGRPEILVPVSALIDFYPRPPRGGRPEILVPVSALIDFYPRPPRGGRPGHRGRVGQRAGNFYPRPPRGGRPSILIMRGLQNKFLPTPSARRATKTNSLVTLSIEIFLPTPSARRATRPGKKPLALWCNFYPRPPRGGRRCAANLAG